MTTPRRHRPRHRPCHRSFLALVALLGVVAATACSGRIGSPTEWDPADPMVDPSPGASGAGGRAPMHGPPGPGAAPPGTAPPRPLAPPPPAAVATTRFARLSHEQWENTVRDLLRLPARPGLASEFVMDAGLGFDNAGGVRDVSQALRLDYQGAAETLAARIAGSADALARILPPSPPSDAAGRARAFVRAFGLRAHRRPLDAQDEAEYLALFEKGAALFPGADPFAAGAQLVIAAFLQSPMFLYRTELATAATGRVPLDGYDIASKLSYALTGSMPDDELLAAAAGKTLASAEGVATAARRLLQTPAALAALDHFHRQVLNLDEYERIAKDRRLFPEFSTALIADLKQEPLAFLRHLYASRGTWADVLTAPFTFANRRLAAVYGVAAASDELVKTDLDPTRRAGLLTQAGFLASHATDLQSDIIHRGVFVNREILCVDLPSPPDDVPPLPEGGGRTNRARVEQFTGKGTCGETCHGTWINPAGYAFEAFDALGRHRTSEGGQPVDTSGSYTFADGKKTFANGMAFVRLLADAPQAHACHARHLIQALHGRSIAPEDAPLLAYLGERSRLDALPLQELTVEVVSSPAFTTRLP